MLKAKDFAALGGGPVQAHLVLVHERVSESHYCTETVRHMRLDHATNLLAYSMGSCGGGIDLHSACTVRIKGSWAAGVCAVECCVSSRKFPPRGKACSQPMAPPARGGRRQLGDWSARSVRLLRPQAPQDPAGLARRTCERFRLTAWESEVQGAILPAAQARRMFRVGACAAPSIANPHTAADLYPA